MPSFPIWDESALPAGNPQTFKDFQALRRSHPSLYRSSKMQNLMVQRREELGHVAFFNDSTASNGGEQQ